MPCSFLATCKGGFKYEGRGRIGIRENAKDKEMKGLYPMPVVVCKLVKMS